jgi:hypothetical protein
MNSIPALGGIRAELRSRWPEWATIAAYASVVAFAIPFHEPWTDEAQAWQIARSIPLRAMFQTYIRYEGSPGLWHFLLWVMIRAHISYCGMHWICGAIAVVGISLFIFKSPFPRFLKLTLPFTYYLLFQYAVVARSYVLVPVLLFLIAIQWKKNPVWLAILLGLLANLSLHVAVISGGLAVVYCIEWIRNRDAVDHSRRRQLLFSAHILLCFYAFAIWTAWPPRDLMMSNFRAPARPFIFWAVTSLMGLCDPWILSIPFWICIALCLRARRSLVYLLPVLFFAAFSGAVYAVYWHFGLPVPLVICLLWITWPERGCESPRHEMYCRTALIVMAGIQILWSAQAIVFDHFNAYSPSIATAQFLQPYVRDGATIAVTYLDRPDSVQPDGGDYDDVAILPYFDHNIFANQQNSFWWWSDKNHTEDSFFALLPSHPRIVVIQARHSPGRTIYMEDEKVDLLLKSGYLFTNQFCGSVPIRLGMGLTFCDLIFQRTDIVHPSLGDATGAASR